MSLSDALSIELYASPILASAPRFVTPLFTADGIPRSGTFIIFPAVVFSKVALLIASSTSARSAP